MAFALNADVANRLGRTLTEGEETTVEALIEAATAVIAQAAGEDDAWAAALSPVPNIIKVVTVELVCRALANPNSLQALNETVGSYAYGARFRDAGIFLSPSEELLVRRELSGQLSASAQVDSLVTDADIAS